MSEEEVKALVEMKDMLKAENTKLKQEKKKLKEWLEEEIKTLDKLDERFGKGLLELVLERLGE